MVLHFAPAFRSLAHEPFEDGAGGVAPHSVAPAIPQGIRFSEIQDAARQARLAFGFSAKHHTHKRHSPTALTNTEENAVEFVWFILIGLVAGALAGMIMNGGGYGIVGDIVVGVLGALIGGYLFQQLGISAGGGLPGAIIVATVGAIVLIGILRLINRGRGRGLGL